MDSLRARFCKIPVSPTVSCPELLGTPLPPPPRSSPSRQGRSIRNRNSIPCQVSHLQELSSGRDEVEAKLQPTYYRRSALTQPAVLAIFFDRGRVPARTAVSRTRLLRVVFAGSVSRTLWAFESPACQLCERGAATTDDCPSSRAVNAAGTGNIRKRCAWPRAFESPACQLCEGSAATTGDCPNSRAVNTAGTGIKRCAWTRRSHAGFRQRSPT